MAISPADVKEVRRQIEPALASLAALRTCDADIAGLRDRAARCRAAPDPAAYEAADEILHHRIAELLRNVLFLRVYKGNPRRLQHDDVDQVNGVEGGRIDRAASAVAIGQASRCMVFAWTDIGR